MHQSEVKQEGPCLRTSGGRYRQEFIEEVVGLVNNGLAIGEVLDRYGLPQNTLSEWLKKWGGGAYLENRQRCYSVSFKRKVVRAVEEGGMSAEQARLAFRVKNVQDVRRWRREFAAEKADLVSTIRSSMKKNKPTDKATTTTTPADIEALQKALAEAQMKIVALNTLIDVAEEQLNINIRKKPGAKQ